jgi:hypothetical protein
MQAVPCGPVLSTVVVAMLTGGANFFLQGIRHPGRIPFLCDIPVTRFVLFTLYILYLLCLLSSYRLGATAVAEALIT